MATLISLYKDNRITSSEVESKDIDIVRSSDLYCPWIPLQKLCLRRRHHREL